MSDKKRILAIIPVRSGSKRFPGKNVAQWGGTNLMDWAIMRCFVSGQFDGIIVAGDKGITFEPCDQYTFVERPDELVQDDSDIKDTLAYLDKCGFFDKYTDIALVQATSPLYDAEFIKDAVKTYRGCDIANLVSVNQYTLHEDGGIYLIAVDLLRQGEYRLTSPRLYISVRNKSAVVGRSLDINTYEDFCIGRAIQNKRVV